jgi:hypothetical protein
MRREMDHISKKLDTKFVYYLMSYIPCIMFKNTIHYQTFVHYTVYTKSPTNIHPNALQHPLMPSQNRWLVSTGSLSVLFTKSLSIWVEKKVW